MFVIASHGHAVINGLGQVKVFETKRLAQDMLDEIKAGQNATGFTVQAVHFVTEGGE
jgi:hypothetical protein